MVSGRAGVTFRIREVDEVLDDAEEGGAEETDGDAPLLDEEQLHHLHLRFRTSRPAKRDAKQGCTRELGCGDAQFDLDR